MTSDLDFWSSLEFRVSREMQGIEACRRIGMWCDGFDAHEQRVDGDRLRISGRTWIGLGPTTQEQWTFDLVIAGADASPASTWLPPDDATAWLTIDRERKHLTMVPGDASPASSPSAPSPSGRHP